jgi:hypothetical protein
MLSYIDYNVRWVNKNIWIPAPSTMLRTSSAGTTKQEVRYGINGISKKSGREV